MSDLFSNSRTTALPLAALSTTMIGAIALAAVSFAQPAEAAAPAVLLGTSAQYAVLAGAGVTNTGSTTITTADASVRGDVGTSPNGTIDGGSGISWVLPAVGSFHVNDTNAALAQADSLTAYGVAANAPSEFSLGGQLDGATLKPGVHTASSALDLAVDGTVTLDADGDGDAIFVIQVGSSLTLNSNSTVSLVDGANACRVFWQVSEDATIGTDVEFVGTLLAENAIVAQTDATIEGRLLAQNAAVTLDSNTFTLPSCATVVTPTPSASTPAPTVSTPAPTVTPTRATPTRPRASTPSRDRDGEDSEESIPDTDGGSDGGGGTDGGGGADGGGGGDDGSFTTTSTPGLPNTGGAPWFLAPAGATALLVGAGLMYAGRTRRGMHRS